MKTVWPGYIRNWSVQTHIQLGSKLRSILKFKLVAVYLQRALQRFEQCQWDLSKVAGLYSQSSSLPVIVWKTCFRNGGNFKGYRNYKVNSLNSLQCVLAVWGHTALCISCLSSQGGRRQEKSEKAMEVQKQGKKLITVQPACATHLVLKTNLQGCTCLQSDDFQNIMVRLTVTEPKKSKEKVLVK